MSQLRSMKWVGGKAFPRLQKWIISQLPTDRSGYCEPFAGMLGVLLNRPRAKSEVVNDRYGAVMNWWDVVRTSPMWLTERLILTPLSRTVYEKAVGRCDDRHAAGVRPFELMMQERLDWAVDFTVAVMGSFGGKFGAGWEVRFEGRRHSLLTLPRHIMPLAKRLYGVQLECDDALNVLKRTQKKSDLLLYVDPPYRTLPHYYQHDLDQDALEHLLIEQRGLVAVSGVPHDRPILEKHGWERREIEQQVALTADDNTAYRTECLWVNWR